MAAPTITSVTPSTGPTGGQYLVEIVGTNFQLPPSPPLTGPTEPLNPSVAVYFGDQECSRVSVLSTTRLHVIVPAANYDPTVTAPGPVTVTVKNINQLGAPIPGETGTLAAGFTYALPVLETSVTTESTLARITRALVVELRRQVLNNVEMTVHTDFADMPGTGVAMLSSVPGLVLSGPRLRRNPYYTENALRVQQASSSTYVEASPPYTVDLVFTLTGVDDSMVRLLNLMQEVSTFFLRNRYLRLLRDPAAPNAGYVRYEMGIEPNGDPSIGNTTGAVENSNIRTFSGEFSIVGVDLDDPLTARAVTGIVEDILIGGVISDGSGTPPQADGSPPPPAGIGYLIPGITLEQKLP